jgi:hypothetical protein
LKATLLCLALLENYFKKYKEDWELLATKAKEWVKLTMKMEIDGLTKDAKLALEMLLL